MRVAMGLQRTGSVESLLAYWTSIAFVLLLCKQSRYQECVRLMQWGHISGFHDEIEWKKEKVSEFRAAYL